MYPVKLKNWVKANLPPSAYRRFARMTKGVLGWRYRKDLTRLAELFKTDKWGAHWYMEHYQRYLAPLRTKSLNLLEIGVGGYEYPDRGGESLRMWKAYFRRSRIVGIDLYDKSQLREKRIDIRQCDQTDSLALTRLSSEYQGFDIIIDDGSHRNDHVITTFQILFPLLRANGVYVVEDTQTSYWPSKGGRLGTAGTSMAFFKALADGLNYVEYPIQNYEPTYFDRHIVEIAFFHNLIIIRKGINDEPANAPELIQRELSGWSPCEIPLG